MSVFDNGPISLGEGVQSGRKIYPTGERVTGNELTECKIVEGEKDGRPWKALVCTWTLKHTDDKTRQGASISDRIFDNTERGPNQTEEDHDKSQTATLQKLKQIAEAYLEKEKVANIQAESILDVMKVLEKTLPSAAKGKKTALKVTLRLNRYPQLPLYGNFISTELNPLAFQTNPKYDKYVIEEVTPTNAGDIGGGATGAADTDEPPF